MLEKMNRICDRSPCDKILPHLGKIIYGNQHGGFTMEIESIDNGYITMTIEYCPFCGTRLSEVDDAIKLRFMSPRLRHVKKKHMS